MSPFLFINMPVWWNGIHSGLRNRGESMRVQLPPQVLCAYIRIGIGAALRMQSGKPVEVRVLLRTLYALVAELEYASDLSSVICEFKSHRGYNGGFV